MRMKSLCHSPCMNRIEPNRIRKRIESNRIGCIMAQARTESNRISRIMGCGCASNSFFDGLPHRKSKPRNHRLESAMVSGTHELNRIGAPGRNNRIESAAPRQGRNRIESNHDKSRTNGNRKESLRTGPCIISSCVH